jgi:hypothetical protein
VSARVLVRSLCLLLILGFSVALTASFDREVNPRCTIRHNVTGFLMGGRRVTSSTRISHEHILVTFDSGKWCICRYEP